MTGEKERLVLVHGLGSASSFWDNVLDAFEEDFDVRAIDLPGHGTRARRVTPKDAHPRALAEAVIEVLADHGGPRPHVVGISLGGWVALEMASLGAVASVTALAPAGLWSDGTRARREWESDIAHHLLVLSDPLLPILTGLPLVKELGLRTTVVHPRNVSTAQFLAAACALGQTHGYGVFDRVALASRFEGADAITVPVTVAFGDTDRVLPATTSQNRALLPAQAAWRTIEGCGHAMTWDRPDRCVALVRETVRQATVT